MTCRYSQASWRDVLYTDVCRTPGGIIDAARFLTERRGKSIHPETLRTRLRGTTGEDVGIEMASFLSEWMAEKVESQAYARHWMVAWTAEQGLHTDDVPPAPAGGWLDEAQAFAKKLLDLGSHFGRISGSTAAAIEDGRIDQDEVNQMLPDIREARVMLHRMERNLLRAGFKSEGL